MSKWPKQVVVTGINKDHTIEGLAVSKALPDMWIAGIIYERVYPPKTQRARGGRKGRKSK